MAQNEPKEYDSYFPFLCDQIRQVYANEYYKCLQLKQWEKAQYFRGKLDAYCEIQNHYKELNKDMKTDQ